MPQENSGKAAAGPSTTLSAVLPEDPALRPFTLRSAAHRPHSNADRPLVTFREEEISGPWHEPTLQAGTACVSVYCLAPLLVALGVYV